jgi:hypothetical protein
LGRELWAGELTKSLWNEPEREGKSVDSTKGSSVSDGVQGGFLCHKGEVPRENGIEKLTSSSRWNGEDLMSPKWLEHGS